MSRTKPFVLRIEASTEFVKQEPERARAMIRDELREKAKEPLVSPRGGRYRAINEPYSFQKGIDFERRAVYIFTARVTGQYVRPVR